MHNSQPTTYAAKVAKHHRTNTTMSNQLMDTTTAIAKTTTLATVSTATKNDDAMKLLMDRCLLVKLQSLRTLLLPHGMSRRSGRISLPMDAGR